ncbi:MAG: DNA polymerase III subunit gamma/tau [Gemmatimonadota bacterium]|nr:DNA polymerase III subunit gamma/tau [Gemmatimonadota bacterium]
MSYLVLARKYRPLVFGDIMAQRHVTQTLVNAITVGRISHSYLFSGPRGVGKTSTARILARAVNCPQPAGQDPCNKCDNCLEIIQGRSLDVIEIDGASNRGIDEIRDLRERVGYAPSSNRYKVYIIDEVHMLTQEAFNALLKTLEEPPSHVIFIFATTAPHKVPPTIISRCQRFDFKSVPAAQIIAQLEKVLTAEGIEMPGEVTGMIARKADGAMRDALSLCDQVIAFCAGYYTVEKASQVLGILDAELFFELTGMITEHRTADVIRFVDRLADNGVDLEEFYIELARHYRNLILFKLGAKETMKAEVSDSHAQRYLELSQGLDTEDLIRSLQLVLSFEEIIKRSGQQKISLELLLVRLTLLEKSVNISELLSRLESGGSVLKPPDPGIKSSEGQRSPGGPHPYSGHQAPPPARPPQTRQPEPYPRQRQAEKQELPALQSAEKEAGPGPGSKEIKPVETEGEVDLDRFRKDWPGITQGVKKKKISLGAMLGSLKPQGFENGKLVLQINQRRKYYRDNLEKSDSRKIICETIKEFFGIDSIEIEIIATEEGPEENKSPGRDSGKTRNADSFEELCRTDPTMGMIKKYFDPELL